MGGGGFEPPKRNAADLQSAPFGHLGTRPYTDIYFKQPGYPGRFAIDKYTDNLKKSQIILPGIREQPEPRKSQCPPQPTHSTTRYDPAQVAE